LQPQLSFLPPGSRPPKARRPPKPPPSGVKQSRSCTPPPPCAAGKFGEGALVSHDPTYPVWRAGANSATALHTDADLDLGGLTVPKGDYTLFVNVKDPDKWELIVNKQTGQWGLTYQPGQDLGRVKMTMSKPAATVENLKYTLTSEGGNKGKLQLAWESHVASVPLTVK
jgi:hypothetical protein